MSSTINPKPCNYDCNTRIYWNTQENAYFEVFTKKKHICPNRGQKSVTTTTTTGTPSDSGGGITPPSTAQKHQYMEL
jgi:hypothetical protein